MVDGDLYFGITMDTFQKEISLSMKHAINNVLNLVNKKVYYETIGEIYIINVKQLLPGKHGHAKFHIKYIKNKDEHEGIVSIWDRYKILG